MRFTLQRLNVDTHPNNPREVRTLVALRLEREALRSGGAATAALYWSLRRDQSYPFQAFDSALLDEVAARILRAGRVAEAIAMLELNVGLYASWTSRQAPREISRVAAGAQVRKS